MNNYEKKQKKHAIKMELNLKAHEELQKVNEELWQILRNQTAKTTLGALRSNQTLNDA